MHLEVTVVGVGLAREQRLQLAACNFVLQLAQCGFTLGDDGLVLFALTELDERGLIVKLALDVRDRGQLILQPRALLHHALSPRGIVPEIGILGLLVQLGQPRTRLVDVKDASSAVQPTA